MNPQLFRKKPGKQSAFFDRAFKEARKDPEYWAEGFRLALTEAVYVRMKNRKISMRKLSKLTGLSFQRVKEFFAGDWHELVLSGLGDIMMALNADFEITMQGKAKRNYPLESSKSEGIL